MAKKQSVSKSKPSPKARPAKSKPKAAEPAHAGAPATINDDNTQPADDQPETDNDSPDVDEGDVIEVAGEVVDDDLNLDQLDFSPKTKKAQGANRLGREVALSRLDPLQAYLHEIQRHTLLTPDEEKQLTVRYTETQDVAIAARLVTANLRLVVKLAFEYRRAYRNIMDLIQEGNIGLMQAVKRYDPYRGVKLSSYAAWWIRAYILRFILNNWRLVKLGTTQAQRKLFFNLSKEKAKLSALGIEPTTAEIARRLDVDEKEVIDMDTRMSNSEASLDVSVGDTEGRAIARVELMPSHDMLPDSVIESSELSIMVKQRLAEFRKTLKGKELVIFDRRVAADEPMTLQEIGTEFGISRERVRQLEARMLGKLRTYLKDELGDAVDAS